jgi:heterodisulfide reductase subunit C
MTNFLPNIIFIILLVAAIYLFAKNIKRITRNINLGKDVDYSENTAERWKIMTLVALGQSKMITRPVAGIMHIFIYVGFVIINIEVVEILIDGVFGTHRILAFMGSFYNFLIGSFEILALLVLVACVVFFARRNFIYIKRFRSKELANWPKSDANIILIVEVILMSCFLLLNASDGLLQQRGANHYIQAGSFPISGLIMPLFSSFSDNGLIFLERTTWWIHIIGILAFMNYLPYSKHFHILLAFPNVYYSRLTPKGKMVNMEKVSAEVKLMLDPNADPYSTQPATEANIPVEKFGAKDVSDLSWKNLMEAYSCTECGRCSSVCPANQTGKLLSPRKIMMDTRDRLEEVGKNIDKNGKDFIDTKSLLGDYILEEEIWACTTCNACVEACPININPLEIITELRRFSVMENAKAPASLNTMFTNIENNGAPWTFSQADRLKWAEES